MNTNTVDAQMRNEFIELADDVAQVVNEHRQVNVNAPDVQWFLEFLERTATQVRDMQSAVITRNIDRHLAEQAATAEDNADLDDNEEFGFCGCGVELTRVTSSDGSQCDDCADQVSV